MRRSVYLPSYLISGENETSLSSPDYKHCEIDTDCNNQLLCYNFKNLTWLKGNNYENLDFYQHDNVIGSLNYVKLTQKPQYNYCGCPTLGGWDGYDCNHYHGTNYLELVVFAFAIIVLFIVFLVGTYDLLMQIRTYGIRRINNRTSIALILCVLSVFPLLVGRILYIKAFTQPNYFVPQPNGRKIIPGMLVMLAWTNNISVIFNVICMLQISYCWIEVSQNVAKMRKENEGYDRQQKIVLFLEASVTALSSILIFAGFVSYCFIAVAPWGIAIILLNTIGARRITSVMGELLSSSKVFSASSRDNEYRDIILSIKRTSKCFTVLVILACICGAAIFQISFVDPESYGYAPGLWHRPLTWWFDVLFCIVFPLCNLTAFLYLHPRVSNRKTGGSAKNKSSVQDQDRKNDQEVVAVRPAAGTQSDIHGSTPSEISSENKKGNM